MPEGEAVFADLIRGEVRFAHETIGDPVIVKSNGYPTYNFASPVDDADMRITHVLRGEEHLSNTPLQLMLLDALGQERPQAFAHLPVIVGKDHKKLSKRLHPETRLGLYQELGYLPEGLLNYLALLGWNPGTEQEIFDLAGLVREFDIARVQRSPAMFDWDRLDWIDGHHIRALGDDELARRLGPYVPELPPETLRRAAPALKERLQRLDRAGELLAFVLEEPPAPKLDPAQRAMVAEVRERLGSLQEWTAARIEAVVEALREAQGWSRGKLFTPLRLCVAGRVAPPIFDTLALLPQAEVLRRLDRVLR